uniref:Uncharacterized protein n=1 Tax=Mastacembelus armatus TaxID=205130 RepID=A0A3Q3N8B7_9TELE
MVMMMLLLVCTMAPLVILAGPVTIRHKLDENLNQIIDLVEEYNKSLNRVRHSCFCLLFANCTELLKDVTPNGISIELPELTEYLVMCIRQRNFSMG